jgi:uncharacterized protein YbjT (DUF2867 family)
MTHPHILVTGAGGVVSSALVHELTRQAVTPRLAFHSPEHAERARSYGADAWVIDISAPETLAPALVGIDALFLVDSGIIGQFEREVNVLREAKRAGVKHIVKVSAWQADAEAYDLARIHRAIERAIEASGLAYTFLRPNGFMQNFVTHKAAQIRRGSLFEAAGEARISHVDARDVAAVGARALLDPRHIGRAYELSGPSALTYAEVAAAFSCQLGRAIQYIAISEIVARSALIEQGMPSFHADALIDIHRYHSSGAGALVSDAIERITGRPAIPFERFVADYASMWR